MLFQQRLHHLNWDRIECGVMGIEPMMYVDAILWESNLAG
jgi:hypothetical protein